MQEEESPLLNAPPPMLTVTVVPGVAEKVESVNVGVASTMKVSEACPAGGPLLLVTVTVIAPGTAPVATVNDPVIVPELMLQVGAGEPENNVAEAERIQVESRLGNPFPVTVTLVFIGPSEGERNIAAPTTGAATVNVAEAESPKVPCTVTV